MSFHVGLSSAISGINQEYQQGLLTVLEDYEAARVSKEDQLLKELENEWKSRFLSYLEGPRTPDQYIYLTKFLHDFCCRAEHVPCKPYRLRLETLNLSLKKEHNQSILPSHMETFGDARLHHNDDPMTHRSSTLDHLERILPDDVETWDDAKRSVARRVLAYVERRYWKGEKTRPKLCFLLSIN
jgi:hypothetical protein